jgi:hypothetical protein
MYYFGAGVSRDLKRAAELFAAASSAGNTLATYGLARLYYRGEGVPRDLVRAAGLFEDAAREGDVDAQLFLARMLMLGEGVEADPVAAFTWLTVASAQDQAAAGRLLERLRRELSADQIARAEAEAMAFTPTSD